MMNQMRASWPSFFIFLTLIFALITSSITGYIFWWGAITLMTIVTLIKIDSKINVTLLSVSLTFFLLILALNNTFISPVYSAEPTYFICFLAVSFFLGANFSQVEIKHALIILLCIFSVLSVWGIVQYMTGLLYLVDMSARANTIFYTPNTFAAALNIALLPSLVMYVFSNKVRTVVLISAGLMFTALLMTQSRGGYISFIIGVTGIFLLQFILKIEYDFSRFKKILILMILICLSFSAVEIFNLKFKGSFAKGDGDISQIIREAGMVESTNHRVKLYDIAWQQIKQAPLLGSGYYTYQYYQLRDQYKKYAGATRYTHNDYLQIWMETGIFGLVALVSILFSYLYLVFRYKQQFTKAEKVSLTAIGAALISLYTHAWGDFVFYPPFLLLLFGAYLGVSNQIFGNYNRKLRNINFENSIFHIRSGIVKSLLVLIIIVPLSYPAVAQLTFDEANRRVSTFHIAEALPLYEVARRFAPYEPEYYRYEAALFVESLSKLEFRESANRADELFKSGHEANPYKGLNLLSRAILHRDYSRLLDNPVSCETMIRWMEEVLIWHPHDTFAQAEIVKTLDGCGYKVLAKEKLMYWNKEYPDSKLLQSILLEFEL